MMMLVRFTNKMIEICFLILCLSSDQYNVAVSANKKKCEVYEFPKWTILSLVMHLCM